jgi:hypothetical protein
MHEITLEATVVRSNDVLVSPVDNELVMMDLERGMYYALNAIGADIWARLAQPVAVADLCDQLMQKYEVDRATCQADVLTVLNEMAANGLLAKV